MRRIMHVAAVAALGVTLGVAGCGGGSADESAATQTTTHESEHEMETTATATQQETQTETAPAPQQETQTETAPAPKRIRIVVRSGRVEGGIRRPSVDKGEKVVLVVDTDAGEYVHVHGYDISKDVVVGTPTRVVFTATTPGRFEVELHNPSVVIADLQVKP